MNFQNQNGVWKLNEIIHTNIQCRTDLKTFVLVNFVFSLSFHF